jgi:hypothetical protein
MNISQRLQFFLSLGAVEFSEKDKQWMPEWVTKHPGIQSYPKPQVIKIFNQFGLKDFREKIESKGATDNLANFLIVALTRLTEDLMQFTAFSQFSKKEEIEQYTSLIEVTSELIQELQKDETWQEDKARLVKQVKSINNKFRLDAGMSVIKAYEAIRKFAKTIANIDMPDLISRPEFKEYSKRGSHYVVFSTNASDIAAMSSRSDWDSCQTITPNKGVFTGCVIGSILSKFLGICYITTGKDYLDRGETMIARCLVRFAIDTETNKPSILLDKMYPQYFKNFGQEMIKALNKRSSVPIIDLNKEIGFARFRIPEERLDIYQGSGAKQETTYLDNPDIFTSLKKEKENEDKPNRRVSYLRPFINLIGDNAAKILLTKFSIFINQQYEAGNITNKAIYYNEEVLDFNLNMFKHMFAPIAISLFEHYKKHKNGFMESFLYRFIEAKLLGKDSQNNGSNSIDMFLEHYGKDKFTRNGDLARLIEKYGREKFLALFTKWVQESIRF